MKYRRLDPHLHNPVEATWLSIVWQTHRVIGLGEKKGRTSKERFLVLLGKHSLLRLQEESTGVDSDSWTQWTVWRPHTLYVKMEQRLQWPDGKPVSGAEASGPHTGLFRSRTCWILEWCKQFRHSLGEPARQAHVGQAHAPCHTAASHSGRCGVLPRPLPGGTCCSRAEGALGQQPCCQPLRGIAQGLIFPTLSEWFLVGWMAWSSGPHGGLSWRAIPAPEFLTGS